MTEAEIMEAFITAAETEMKMPKTGEAPSKNPRGYVLHWVHSDADITGWGKDWRNKAKNIRSPTGDKTHQFDDPIDHWRWDWLFEKPLKAEREDIANWERCIEWTRTLLDDPRERRALWAWSFAKAGGMPLAKWCRRIEKIHPETAARRKNRAVARISAELARKGSLHIESGGEGVLPCGPVFGESDAILADDASPEKRSYSWAADGAFTRIFDADADDFSWSDKRNELRRKRQERKRQAA